MAGIPYEQYVVDAEGKRKGILQSIERYEQVASAQHLSWEVYPSYRDVKRRILAEGLLRRFPVDLLHGDGWHP